MLGQQLQEEVSVRPFFLHFGYSARLINKWERFWQENPDDDQLTTLITIAIQNLKRTHCGQKTKLKLCWGQLAIEIGEAKKKGKHSQGGGGFPNFNLVILKTQARDVRD